MVKTSTLERVRLMKTTQIQTLHHTVHKETKVLRAQNITHTGRKQICLIRRIRKITGHSFLSLNLPVENKYSHRLFSPRGNVLTCAVSSHRTCSELLKRIDNSFLT